MSPTGGAATAAAGDGLPESRPISHPAYANAHVRRWVEEVAGLVCPDHVVYADGSEEERVRLSRQAIAAGELVELNADRMPGCYLHRSDPHDVARTEHQTLICTRSRDDAGPTNNWMVPSEAYTRLRSIYTGSMRGRTMYVVPFIMGVPGSPFRKIGVQVTDSLYVVLSMRIMTRMGRVALRELGDSGDFTRCLHGKADLNPDRRYICHFPEDNVIWSVGSGYGGNALLGKKCLALRIASWQARREGWLAEHMLIAGIERPGREVEYIAAAFPSQCGKTNLAMLVPPPEFEARGFRVWTVGDDIAWLRVGPDGRLWAMNPEAGFFGVAPGTGPKTNPNALAAVQSNSIFTNVGLKKDGTVWWEGLSDAPSDVLDWRGRPWTSSNGFPAAHPNGRFTAPARQCPSISSRWEDPGGVPLSAIVFGGRRGRVAPLVFQTLSWAGGVYHGATMATETTAAATGKVGVLRRDPMAMLPFCGYHMGDYFAHWLEMGRRTPRPPMIFMANWFRVGSDGKFLWPGFGQNLRVLDWILSRCEGKADGRETPIGTLPDPADLDLTGLDLSAGVVKDLLAVGREEWLEELRSQESHLDQFGERLPPELRAEHRALEARLRNWKGNS